MTVNDLTGTAVTNIGIDLSGNTPGSGNGQGGSQPDPQQRKRGDGQTSNAERPHDRAQTPSRRFIGRSRSKGRPSGYRRAPPIAVVVALACGRDIKVTRRRKTEHGMYRLLQ